jgi:hypothetical protein
MGRPSSRDPIEPIEPMDLANMRQNDSTGTWRAAIS